MNNIYFKQKLLETFEFSEIDFDLHDFIGFDYEEHDDYIDLKEKQYGYAEAFPIEIDRVLKKLEEMKKTGATHVTMEFHCDHIGYMIDSWEITKASAEEVKEWKKEKRKKRIKTIEDKKKELRAKLEKLENQT